MTIAAASALTVVFTVAVAGKTAPGGFEDFRRSVGRLWPGQGRLPPRFVHVLASVLLATEIVVAAAMVLAIASTVVATRLSGLLGLAFAGATMLLAVYAAVHALALARHVSATCACFGRAARPVGPLSLLRSTLLLAVSLGAALSVAIDPTGSIEVRPALSGIAVVTGCAAGLLFVSLEDVVDLFRGVPVRAARRGG